MSQTVNVNGNFLRKLRKEKGMSRAILAERSNEDGGTTIHAITIERMENEPDKKFRPDSVKSVARVLECPQSALTNEADNIVPVVCERIVQGRELYDLLKDAEGVEFDAEVEPSEPEVQQAVLRLVGNAGKIVQGQTGGTFTDVLQIKYEMRQDIDTLAASKLFVFAGRFHRLEAFRVGNIDPQWPEGEEITWVGPFDPKKAHPLFDTSYEGWGFRSMLMISLGDEAKDTLTVEGNSNPCDMQVSDPFILDNAKRVSAGETPLTYSEFEELETNDE